MKETKLISQIPDIQTDFSFGYDFACVGKVNIQYNTAQAIQHVIQFFISKIFQKIIWFFFWSCQLTCFLTGLPHKYIFYCKRLHYFESSYHKNTRCLFLSLMKRSIPPPPFNHFKTCPLEGLQS